MQLSLGGGGRSPREVLRSDDPSDHRGRIDRLAVLVTKTSALTEATESFPRISRPFVRSFECEHPRAIPSNLQG
jgi:hypothetical protein